MDPDETLAQIRSILRRRDAGVPLAADAARLPELVESLDGWLSGGGFPPAGWGPTAGSIFVSVSWRGSLHVSAMRSFPNTEAGEAAALAYAAQVHSDGQSAKLYRLTGDAEPVRIPYPPKAPSAARKK